MRATTVSPAVGSQEKKHSFYRPELDCLRFCAFFMVFLTHSMPHTPDAWVRYHLPRFVADLLASLAKAGKYGVTLFFILSAYLITTLLLQERTTTRNVSLKSFYVRRILRIWPLYFFAVGLAVTWPWSGRLPLDYLPGFLLLAGNWVQIILGSPHSWAQILWSVSIEEQFYLTWPLATKLLSRKTLTLLALVMISIANLTRVYISTLQLPDMYTWSNTFAQLDAFGIGILCAILPKGLPRFSLRVRLWIVVGGLIFLISAGHFYPAQTPALLYPLGTAGCLLFFLAAYGSEMSFKPLVYLGKISYGLYVYHVLALTMMFWVVGNNHFVVYSFGGLALTMLLAMLSYRFLESPFLRLKDRFAVIKTRPV